MLTAVDQQLKIVPYEPAHREAFRQLNQAWITRYFRLEEADNRALNDPEGYILNKGGFIFMALWEGAVVGACALIKVNQRVFELAKMAVSETVQGKGIGYALGKACIDKAKELGIKKVELLSNTRLQPAIHLYKKLGFIEVPLPPTEYERADIKMEIHLQDLMKAVMIIASDLPAGLAINTAAVLGASLGNKLPYMIAEDLQNASGGRHAGLTWIPLPMLKATREDIKRICGEAKQQGGLLVIDLSEVAQTARSYETYKASLEGLEEAEINYSGIAVYGDKTTINRLTRKLELYK
ncbi:GNAT family N-acetyltransferase [Paraflavitalea soli]|uniref:GNAT family N-acetyltransferase n=1 Tax=Paraflavitalea soli TaxID=2315862 RepID=A0A3B7MMS2_9BACT|nr:GNAT family N-acetyltransferase [Paraflavitalea soli]AXY75814.1 GNAT family N-acetyltransferase [Paraflavitalea soli]